MTIEWRPVVGYEGRYEVSSDGQVKSLRRQSRRGNGTTQWIPPRMLKSTVWNTGYRYVTLCADGKRANVAVHRLVATAFLRPPLPGEAVCHGDGNKLNNTVENLRWGSSSENQLDNVRNGVHHFARKTHCPQGHEYNAENTYQQANGYRQCKVCGRARDRSRRWEPEEAGERHRIDVTHVAPGELERMARSGARPSPELRAAIDRARDRKGADRG